MAIIQGEAQVGKTCIKSLILKLPYSEVSTSCIEAPCMAFGSFSINDYGKTDSNCWTHVTESEMDAIVIAEIQKIASSSKDIKRHSVTKMVQDSDNDDSRSIPVNNPPVKDTGEPVNVEQKHAKELNKGNIYKYLKEISHSNRIDFDRDWLYFFDSGGQIQFQKLLLAFMPCSSVLVLVVNLSKDLSDPSSTSMKLTDATIAVDEYSLKVEDVLKQVLSAVASNTRQFMSMMKSQQHIEGLTAPENEKLQVITIGTHRDKYDQLIKEGRAIEDIKTKREKINSILQSKSICVKYQDDIHDIHPLHEVDGSKAERGEYEDPVIDTISKALNEQAYHIKVPLMWHYFSVVLRKETKDTNGILSLTSCEEFGELLGMSKDEVISALNFFHALKLIFYYHDSPAKDIVFVRLDAVINIIRELMTDVCKSRKNPKTCPKELKELGDKGCLSIEVLKKNAGPLKGKEDILLGLFEYLKIAALIQTGKSGQTDKTDEVFLMPALLPVKDVSGASTFSKTPPLIFHFNDEPVPMGLFCAVIVQLLSYSGDEKWGIITKERNFSNFFTIQKKITKYRMCKVLLVEQLYCIEIYCEELCHRQSINNCIKKAINDVMKDKIIDNEQPITTFYCPCKDQEQHVATVEDNVLIMCSRTSEWQDLSDSQCDEYWSWFMTQQEIDQAKHERQGDKPIRTLEGEFK